MENNQPAAAAQPIAQETTIPAGNATVGQPLPSINRTPESGTGNGGNSDIGSFGI